MDEKNSFSLVSGAGEETAAQTNSETNSQVSGKPALQKNIRLYVEKLKRNVLRTFKLTSESYSETGGARRRL